MRPSTQLHLQVDFSFCWDFACTGTKKNKCQNGAPAARRLSIQTDFMLQSRAPQILRFPELGSRFFQLPVFMRVMSECRSNMNADEWLQATQKAFLLCFFKYWFNFTTDGLIPSCPVLVMRYDSTALNDVFILFIFLFVPESVWQCKDCSCNYKAKAVTFTP